MAATVSIRDYTSTGPTATVVSTAIRFKHADNSTADANNPMVKPGTGLYDRSYIKHLGLYTADGPTNNITNGKFYSATPATGQAFYAYASATYAQSTADAASGNDSTYTANPTSGSPVTFLSTTHTGTGTIGNYVRLYARLADTVAAPGTLSNVALTFSYDET
jgi:hypothetical protein